VDYFARFSEKSGFDYWTKTLIETMGRRFGVGYQWCPLMRAMRAQTCAQHHISIIGGQTAGSIAAQIGTNNHLNNGQKCSGSAIASAHKCAPHIQHRRPIGWADRGPKWYKHSCGTMGRRYGGRRSRVRIDVRAARSTTYPALAPKWQNRLNPKLVQKLIGAMGTSYGGRCRNTQSARSARTSAKCESTGMEQGVMSA
jgi:hypothetical protein